MKTRKLRDKDLNIVDGPLLLELDSMGDERGYFFEKWNKKNFNNLFLNPIPFVQDNISKSKKGVLRGLHYQIEPKAQGKLVSCIYGEIFDVAVDIRKSSPTYGSWVAEILSEKNKYQLWIPDGFAHGFLTISNEAIVHYKTSDFWSAIHERSILWNDKDINISWPLKFLEGLSPLLSDKDASAKNFNDISEKDLFK